MPIDSKHPLFKSRSAQWERCRDAYEGQDAIKAKGRKYLPMLTKQKLPDYKAYKDRALFFSITRKTVSALVGMAMVRSPIIEFPDEMASYFKDDQGIQFYEIFATVLAENLLMGRVGIFVDRPASGGPPKLCRYYTENIINWECDDKGLPVWVVLQETASAQGKDRYEKIFTPQYRLLELVDKVFQVTVLDSKGKIVQPTVIPSNGGTIMDFIPFFVATPFGVSFDIESPPMLEIVDINLSHYCTSADLEHGRHFTALPTPVVSGASTTTELFIGSQTAWVLPDPNAKASFLEFTGQGLQSLEKALVEKQGQLASMSARLLDNSSRGSEAEGTVRLRYASETASLALSVRSTEALLQKVYSTVALMETLEPTAVKVELNKEFLDSRLTSSDIVNYVRAYLEGGITEGTLVYNLRRGDAYPNKLADNTEINELKAMRATREATAKAQQTSRNQGQPTT